MCGFVQEREEREKSEKREREESEGLAGTLREKGNDGWSRMDAGRQEGRKRDSEEEKGMGASNGCSDEE